MSPVTMSAFKYVLATLPYVHNKFFQGLTHRRFEVFAVAFIMIVRVKLTRARIRLFIGDSDSNEKKKSSWRGDGDDDNEQNGYKTSAYGESVDEDAIWDANYEISARFMYASVIRLRGLWTKSAQYISSRADVMPVPYIRELGKLMDEAPETPWEDVHVANLKTTGEKVVVKVQHPSARATMTDDFVSLKIISRIVTLLEP
eukprot:3496152-Ditylum_brightwellii.AAC.1